MSLRITRHPLDPVQDLSITKVIEVGATDRVWEPSVKDRWPGAIYKSLDLDRTNKHDFYSFDEVDERFDLLICVEVLEHIPHRDVLGFLRSCLETLKPGGSAVFTVPNILTPATQFEFTHCTAYQLMDLGGVLNLGGFECQSAWRMFLGSTKRFILHEHLLRPLHRALRVDYAMSVLIIAQRPNH